MRSSLKTTSVQSQIFWLSLAEAFRLYWPFPDARCSSGTWWGSQQWWSPFATWAHLEAGKDRVPSSYSQDMLDRDSFYHFLLRSFPKVQSKKTHDDLLLNIVLKENVRFGEFAAQFNKFGIFYFSLLNQPIVGLQRWPNSFQDAIEFSCNPIKIIPLIFL